ncbi:MAG: M15 family metallopeptidase [Candidatus Omnitrophica bacterium]|nr:M15 family metallopeptidase [Candidatus Omnitrophota bacterium]
MAKRYLFLFIVLTLGLSGCVTVQRPPVVRPERFARGTIENPIVDSNITLSEALRKYAPEKFKARQRMVEVLYYSFDGKVHKGQIVIEKRLVGDIQEVFRVALDTRFPIKSVIPISHDKFYRDGEFNSDGQSMLSNNTSAFNYRKATGSKKLSMHSYGFAIDINPVQNPYIKGKVILPEGAVYDPSKPGALTRNCAVVRTFKRLGWDWGGDWKSLKDYQHFEKVLRRH